MLDFKKIISSTNLYNFHSHTEFCDGHAPMTTMARSAVEAGFKHYGFTPHSPIPIESPCNMNAGDVDKYLAEFESIVTDPQYSSCHFYKGMEIDYLGTEWGPASPYFRNLSLDYTIGSVHFIPSQEGKLVDIDGRFENFRQRMEEHFHNDIEYVVETFFNQTEAMLQAGCFDILGHFDKISQNASLYTPGIEQSSFYRGKMVRIIDLIVETRPVVELNTKARQDHGRFFPSIDLLPELVSNDITVIVNSDAHRPDRINAGRPEALTLLGALQHNG